MKDIVIKWKWVKRELVLIVAFYILANLVNIASIIIYKTSWNELIDCQRFVLYLGEWFYIISVVVRLIYFGIKLLIRK